MVEYNLSTTLAPMNEEPAWAQWGKNLYRIKKSLNWVLVMWHVWLVWILTTKHKSLKRVETCQKCISIPDCFAMFTHYFRINLQMVLLSRYISFWFVPHWTLDCSFAFEWRHSYLGSERIRRLCFVDYTCTLTVLAYWSLQSYLLACIERQWLRSSVTA